MTILSKPFESCVYVALLATVADVVGIPASVMTMMSYEGRGLEQAAIVTTSDGSEFSVYFPDMTDLPEPAYGDEAVFIGNVQKVLIDAGFFKGSPDGVLDEATQNAVRRAEYVVGLPPSGNPTYDLFEALDFLARNRDLVKTIQEILAERGEIKSEPSGLFDLETRDAIIRAERYYGLRQDGFPDIRLWNTLMSSLINKPTALFRLTAPRPITG